MEDVGKGDIFDEESPSPLLLSSTRFKVKLEGLSPKYEFVHIIFLIRC